jgi:hypothetical protein
MIRTAFTLEHRVFGTLLFAIVALLLLCNSTFAKKVSVDPLESIDPSESTNSPLSSSHEEGNTKKLSERETDSSFVSEVSRFAMQM